MDPNLFSEDMDALYEILSVRFINSSEEIDSEVLADKWNISKILTRKIINATTRLCPRNISNIILNRRCTSKTRGS